MTNPSWFSILAWLHGAFYFLTGIWPIISIDTFQRVTGPKTDLWLVRTIGAVLAVIGLALGVAGYRDSPTPEIMVLALGAAAALNESPK
ncbi:MAG: hypothetical protein ACO1RT_08285 [Planctomycetaceae bacterium]